MQIPEEIKKSVCFVCYLTKKGNKKLVGTGFFISLPMESNPNYVFVYLVTAKHVIVKAEKSSSDGNIWLRINTKEGYKMIPVPISLWISHAEDSSVDAVVFACGPIQAFDVLTIPISMAATEDVLSKEAIGIGDEVFLTGLFCNHHGKKKNIPIVRVGNIAAMPEEPIASRFFGNMDAYLIEARSIGGLSGSPVFVNLSNIRSFKNKTQLRNQSFYWLGLMHGHWDFPLIDSQDIVVEDSISKEVVNMGIGIVVPAPKILEIINQPFFSKKREVEIARVQKIEQSKKNREKKIGVT